jgi:hypothetical protein
MNEKTADKKSLEIKRFVNAPPCAAFTTRGLLDRLEQLLL